MILFELALHDNVIHICRDYFVLFEHFGGHAGESVPYVLKPLCHSSEAVCSKRCDETCLFLVFLVHLDLLIAQEKIKK